MSIFLCGYGLSRSVQVLIRFIEYIISDGTDSPPPVGACRPHPRASPSGTIYRAPTSVMSSGTLDLLEEGLQGYG